MNTKTYVLTVPNSPKSVNAGGGGARSNPFVAAREKKMWEGRFLMELLAARVRKHMEFCSVDVTVRFKHKGGGKGRDEENFRHPVLKPLLDALVKGAYIEDDGTKWVKVVDFRLEEGVAEWPYRDARVKSELIIRLEGVYD